jgi:hypothetical protein
MRLMREEGRETRDERGGRTTQSREEGEVAMRSPCGIHQQRNETVMPEAILSCTYRAAVPSLHLQGRYSVRMQALSNRR